MRRTTARIEFFRDTRYSSRDDGPNGLFFIPVGGVMFKVIASVGEGWEHVSVSRDDRTPTWDEMCAIKSHFWRDEETVVQYHPPKSEYVNHHPHCLHLWRPTEAEIPRPPTYLTGPIAKSPV